MALGELEKLDRRTIAEVKAYARPPDLVMKTMCAVMTAMEKTPSWAQCKAELSDANFLHKLETLDAGNVTNSTVRKLEKYTRDPNFTPGSVGNVSLAGGALCQWVHAIKAC